MGPKDLRALQRREPFEPFRVHLKDGRSYEIRDWGLMLVVTNNLIIGVPAPGEMRSIWEEKIYVPWEEIDHVEMIATTDSSLSA